MAVRTGELAATCDLHVLDAEKVARVRERMEPEPVFQELAETFAAMGDPTRVKIIFALSHSELCVCDLAALLGVSVSAVSHQLRLLRGLRIVKYRREGRLAYYSLDDHHITTLLNQGLEHVGDRAETRAIAAVGGRVTR
jgi:ArsR family transcriptional regulator, lead/cadmium/zinc/bismuth-responsive transcriptional repressor